MISLGTSSISDKSEILIFQKLSENFRRCALELRPGALGKALGNLGGQLEHLAHLHDDVLAVANVDDALFDVVLHGLHLFAREDVAIEVGEEGCLLDQELNLDIDLVLLRLELLLEGLGVPRRLNATRNNIEHHIMI